MPDIYEVSNVTEYFNDPSWSVCTYACMYARLYTHITAVVYTAGQDLE